MELALAYTIIGVTSSLIVGFVGYNWVKRRDTDPKIVGKKLKLYEDMIQELEYEVKRWKGKFNQTKQGVYVQGDYDLSNVDSVEALIQSLLPQVKTMLPKNLQGLADDPKIVKMAIDLYKQNPEKAKELLGKFVKRDSKSTNNEESSSNWINQADSQVL